MSEGSGGLGVESLVCLQTPQIDQIRPRALVTGMIRMTGCGEGRSLSERP